MNARDAAGALKPEGSGVRSPLRCGEGSELTLGKQKRIVQSSAEE